MSEQRITDNNNSAPKVFGVHDIEETRKRMLRAETLGC